MLKLKERYQALKLNHQLKSQKSRLLKVHNKLNKVTSKLNKAIIKDYEKQYSKYNSIRSDYIKFLKNNDLWTESLEKKFGKKETPHKLHMETYDESYVSRLARKDVNEKLLLELKKLKFKSTGRPVFKYGEKEKDDYKFKLRKLEITEDVCRVNKWFTRADWKKHNVPMNRLFKEYFDAAVKYADIKKYYAKQEYDKRSDMYKK